MKKSQNRKQKEEGLYRKPVEQSPARFLIRTSQLAAAGADLSGAWAAAGYDEADFPPIYLYHEPWCRGGAPADAASYVFSGYTIEE